MNTFVLKVIQGVKNYRGRNAEVSPSLPHRHSLPQSSYSQRFDVYPFGTSFFQHVHMAAHKLFFQEWILIF